MMNATTTTTNSDDDDDDTTATAAAPDAEEQQQKHYTSSYSFGLSWQGERKSEKSAHANADNCGKKIEYVMGSCRNCGTERLAVSKDTPALNLPFE
jgi:hypothetical protein